MIHIYCGDGKGKTTCAFGLALRAAGRGNQVIIAQFLKGADSGERFSIAKVPGVTLLEVPEEVKFSFMMNDEEKARPAPLRAGAGGGARAARAGECELVVLDECCAAVSTGLLPIKRVTDFLDGCPRELEVVLTGRDPAPELVERADYITEMRKVKHPLRSGASPPGRALSGKRGCAQAAPPNRFSGGGKGQICR